MDGNDVPLNSMERLTISRENSSSRGNTKDEKNAKNRSKSVHFDEVIGHLEDMLIDEKFSLLQETFLESHWTEFDNSEENKHSYMEIFNSYTNAIEKFINDFLQARIPHFAMDEFIIELGKRKDSLYGEVFEVLFTLTDFTCFKEMFLDYRKVKEESVDLSAAISVIPIRKG